MCRGSPGSSLQAGTLSETVLFTPHFLPFLPHPQQPHTPCGFLINQVRGAGVGSWQGQINWDKATCVPWERCQQGSQLVFMLRENFKVPTALSRIRPCRSLEAAPHSNLFLISPSLQFALIVAVLCSLSCPATPRIAEVLSLTVPL